MLSFFKRFFTYRPNDSQRGMSLIEILLVITLIGGLMTYLINSLTGTADKAKEKQAHIALQAISSYLQMYQLDNGRFPTSGQGLEALLQNPGVKTWRGPYTEPKKLLDPWNVEITYTSDGRDYELSSVGGPIEIFYPDRSGSDVGDGAGGQSPEGRSGQSP